MAGLRVGRLVRGSCILFVAVSALRCSSDPESSASPVDDAGTLDGGRLASGVVTPAAGGVVRTADGRVTIEVPPGAVSADTTVTIRPGADDPSDALLVPGSVYEFGPDGIAFAVPVTVTIAYDAGRIPAGTHEGDLRIFKRLAPSWSEIGGGTVDTTTHAARAELTGFSTYGVRARSASSIVDGSTDQDGVTPEGEIVAVDPESYPVGRLRVYGSYVYWTSFTSIRRAPIAGGAVETLAGVVISESLRCSHTPHRRRRSCSTSRQARRCPRPHPQHAPTASSSGSPPMPRSGR